MYANENALIKIFENEKMCSNDMSTRNFLKTTNNVKLDIRL